MYDDYISTDVLGDHLDGEQRALDQQAEDAREQRWTAFTLLAQSRRDTFGNWASVLELAVDAMTGDSYGVFPEACVQFAETEHWSGVFSAIAQVMRLAGE